MGNVQTTGPNQAVYISGGVLRESSPDYVCCRRVLRLHLQEDSGGGLGLGLVAGHRRPEVQYPLNPSHKTSPSPPWLQTPEQRIHIKALHFFTQIFISTI